MKFIPRFIQRRIAHRPNLLKIVDNVGWLFADNIFHMGIGLVVGIWVARYDSSKVLQEYFTSRNNQPRGFRGIGMDGGGNTYLAGYFADSLSLPGLPLMDYDSFTGAMFLTRIGDISTSITTAEVPEEVEIYPVPSSGMITVRSSKPFTGVAIHDAMGAQIHEDSFSPRTIHTFQLDRSGYYACTVFNNDRRLYTRKLLVLR